MTQCVILWRNTQPGRGGIGFISKDDQSEEIAVFKDYDEAKECAMEHPLFRAFPYQIVELDDL